MSYRPDFAALNRFTKAKGLPRVSRVGGSLREVYLNPDRVQVIAGRNINGTRGVESAPPKGTDEDRPSPSTD